MTARIGSAVVLGLAYVQIGALAVAMADEIVREYELENLLAPRHAVEASGDE